MTGVNYFSVRGKGKAASTSANATCIAYAHSLLRADKTYFTRVHAAQLADINRKRGCVAVTGYRRDGCVADIHIVRASGDTQVCRKNTCINFHRAGNHVSEISLVTT